MNQFHLTEIVSRYVLPWQEILLDFTRIKIKDVQIISRLDVSPSTYYGWKTGTEPKHSQGIAILALHASLCGPERTEERLAQAKKIP